MTYAKTNPVAFFLILLSFFLLTSCDSKRQYDYYENKENYLSVTGTVSYIKMSDDGTALYIAFDNMSAKLSDNCFKIVGKNLSMLRESTNNKLLQNGDVLSFVTAPRYFGDGYVMPIVSIKHGEVELLKFDEGVDNLLHWIASQ